MHRIVIAIATLSVLATPALAQHHDRDFDHDRGRGGFGFDFRVGPAGPDVRFSPDFHGRFIGLGRHFWRGTWYDYGVGPCWGLGPDGRYRWICD